MRIFGLGDLHVDFPANRALVDDLSAADYVEDVLLVAGDVAHRLELIQATLASLRPKFARIFFVPGNHDLWVTGAATDVVEQTSLDRVDAIGEICRAEAVEMTPAQVGALCVVPLLSWYEPGLDGGEGTNAVDAADEVMRRLGRRWADRRYCRWPERLADDAARCRHFAALNEQVLEAEVEVVSTGALLTFSHFCPRVDLLPDVAHLRFKYLPKVAGTPHLERQIRSYSSRLHLYGHTHIPQDKQMEGVHYVNAPLGYPRERQRWGREGLRMKLLVEDAQTTRV